MVFHFSALFSGFGVGVGLVAIVGAQGVFILKQAILKEHVFIISLIAALIDASLIVVGVLGFDMILDAHPLFQKVARYGGAAFLAYYGLSAFITIFKTERLSITKPSGREGMQKAVITLLALTVLNPHVYLDNVVVVGGIGAQLPDYEQPSFMLGAIVASFVYFFGLGYGGRVLIPLFSKPKAWKVFNVMIGLIMWAMALLLIFEVI